MFEYISLPSLRYTTSKHSPKWVQLLCMSQWVLYSLHWEVRSTIALQPLSGTTCFFLVYFSDGFLSCHDRKWLKETANNCHYGRIMQVCQILLVKRLPVPRFQRVRNSLVMHWGGRLLRFNPKTCRMRDLWFKSSHTLRRRQEITAQASEELSVQASRKHNLNYTNWFNQMSVCAIWIIDNYRILGCLGMWIILYGALQAFSPNTAAEMLPASFLELFALGQRIYATRIV